MRGKQPRCQRVETEAGAEFDRWAELAIEVQAAMPSAIHVMDREADGDDPRGPAGGR